MLSANEVAQQVGVAYTTVMLWIKQGKLEAIKREHPRGGHYENKSVPYRDAENLVSGLKPMAQ